MLTSGVPDRKIACSNIPPLEALLQERQGNGNETKGETPWHQFSTTVIRNENKHIHIYIGNYRSRLHFIDPQVVLPWRPACSTSFVDWSDAAGPSNYRKSRERLLYESI